MTGQSPPPLSAREEADLRALAGALIPADAGLGVPGADDAVIFADILRSIGRDAPAVRQGLAWIAARLGGPLAGRDAAALEAAMAALEGPISGVAPAVSQALGRVLLQCYYRDDRVVLALGLEARPPFPKGNVLEQGDWSLLDPVRSRAPMWRDVG